MISVIMPTVRTQWIRESIQSFIDQNYDSELIVINDGTDRDYESILNEFDRTKIRYYKIDHVSIGHTNNFGIGKAKGDIICTLHDDDIMPENSLKVRAEAMGDCEVIWGASMKMSLGGVLGDIEPANEPDKNRIWRQDYINWTTIMWRKSIHDKIGMFADFSHNEDWHFEIRFLQECKCKKIDDIVMYYRIHSGQYSAIGREAGKTKKEEALMWKELKEKYGHC